MTSGLRVLHGDCREVLAGLEAASVDAVVTDPPYGLEFMGKEWDKLKAGEHQPDGWNSNNDRNSYAIFGSHLPRFAGKQLGAKPGVMREQQEWHRTWAEAVLRVLKPGGHLLAFGGTRTYHRMTCAIEDAGFEIRDCLQWIYGSGFPKSLDVSKAIDKHGGAKIAWFGPWLRQERERRGIAQKELSQHFPSKTGGLTGCVANWELGFNMPTAEQFNTLCDVLGLSFDRIEEAEREVVRERTMTQGGGSSLQIRMGERRLVSANITAPATPAAQQWQGWGTALKPAYEPIVLARKPLVGTVAQNVQQYGTGAINVDGCRVETTENLNGGAYAKAGSDRDSYEDWRFKRKGDAGAYQQPTGRWPANILHDGSDEVVALFPQTQTNSTGKSGTTRNGQTHAFGMYKGSEMARIYGRDAGNAARFFYTAKASRSERGQGNTHPTVKPLALMRYLVRLITPPGGLVLDPFVGSGTTLLACKLEGMRGIGIDQDAETVRQLRERYEQVRRPLIEDALEVG